MLHSVLTFLVSASQIWPLILWYNYIPGNKWHRKLDPHITFLKEARNPDFHHEDINMDVMNMKYLSQALGPIRYK
jgi:hypothetical protein